MSNRFFIPGVMLCVALCVHPMNSLLADDAAEEKVKAVLVTGASTGIGRNIAERLAGMGYRVFAGARKQTDLDALNAIENIQAVRLDVTDQGEIDAAVQIVRDAGYGLWGLVNNAGVGVVGPLIEIDEEDFDFQMDVNVYGVYRVTKAFGPLILESEGRITTIGSISGILSRPIYGPYSISKHAVEAYTDSLAAELAQYGVAVSIVEPGSYHSNIHNNVLARMKERNITAEGSQFEKEMNAAIERFTVGQSGMKSSDEVTDAVVHALFDPNPLRRYMVVPNEEQARFTIRKMFEETAQLNQWQAYSYDREELIKILDEVLDGQAQP